MSGGGATQGTRGRKKGWKPHLNLRDLLDHLPGSYINGMSCWPATITNTMAGDRIVSKITDKLSSFVCGISLPTTYDGGYSALTPSSTERPRPRTRPWSSSSLSRVVSASPDDDDDDEEEEECSVRAMSSPRVGGFPAQPAVVPCLAFSSQHGYKVFSLADMRMCDDRDVRLRPVLGRRLVPSPYGGTVLAADVCYRHVCHLVDPFTGEVTPLPDLPIPRSETEPLPCARDEPRPQRRNAPATDDGLAWDWSPRGVVVARGDTAFFFPTHGGNGSWTPVHQSWRGSHMTVNHRAGRFFLLETRSLRTTVIDAATLRVCAVVPPPPDAEDIDGAYLAPSIADVILLVHRAGDRRGMIVTEAYCARLDRRAAPKWKLVEDVGDRAVFVDGAHGFTVRASPRAWRNHVYVTLSFQVAAGGHDAAEYDVGVVDLRKPERQERMRLDIGEVERAWSWQPYWIIPNKDGLRSSRG